MRSFVFLLLIIIAVVMPYLPTGSEISSSSSTLVVEGASFDFAQFKTCKKCVGAGFGWCSIQRICGGFANRNCGEGPRFHRADYDPSGEEEEEEEKPASKKKAETPKEKKKVSQESKSDTTNDVSGKVLPLKVEEVSKAVEKNKMDYWAFYFYDKSVEVGGLGNKLSLSLEQWSQIAKATKRINLLVSAVNIDSLKDSREWKNSEEQGQPGGGVWASVKKSLMNTGAATMKPCIVLLLDNRDDPLPLLQLSSNSEVVGQGKRQTIEAVVGWMNTQIGAAVLNRATGDEKRRRDDLKKKNDHTGVKAEETPPKKVEKKKSTPSKTSLNPPPPKMEEKKNADGSGSRKFSFDNFKTCQECVGAGFGWCSIQRICGGFANQQCGEGPRFHRADYDPEVAAGGNDDQEEVADKSTKDNEPWEDPFEDSF